MSSLEEDQNIARTYSVDSKGRAVFYSGGLNHDRALDYSRRTGSVPLDRTDAGRNLFRDRNNNVYQRNNRRWPQNPVRARRAGDEVSRIASERYAKNARGDVKTFVCGSRANSVFRKTELPLLLKNQKVTSINGIDRNTIAKAYSKDPNRAFRMVNLAELRQDRREAMRTGDKKLLADVLHRQNSYKDAFGKNRSNVPLNERVAKLSSSSRTPAAQTQQQKTSRTSGSGTTAGETQKKSPTKTQPPPPQQSPKRGR